MKNVDLKQSELLNKILNEANIFDSYKLYAKAYTTEGKMELGVHSDEVLTDAVLKQVYKKISAIYLGQLGAGHNKTSKIILVPNDIKYSWQNI